MMFTSVVSEQGLSTEDLSPHNSVHTAEAIGAPANIASAMAVAVSGK